jgi:hypothetical protein
MDGLATVRAEALVEHYQKTREQLTRDWVDRNRTDFPQEWLPLRPAAADLAAWTRWATRNFLFFLDVVTALLTARMFWGYVVLRAPSEAAVREAIAKSFRQS